MESISQHRLHSHTDLQHERVENMSWYTAATDHGARCVFVRQVQADITDDKTLTMVKSGLSSFTARWELIGQETLREELQSGLPQIRRNKLLREFDGTTQRCSKRVCDSRDVELKADSKSDQETSTMVLARVLVRRCKTTVPIESATTLAIEGQAM